MDILIKMIVIYQIFKKAFLKDHILLNKVEHHQQFGFNDVIKQFNNI